MAAPFDNGYVMVWTRQSVTSFLPVPGKKEQETFQRFPARWCRRWAVGYLVFDRLSVRQTGLGQYYSENIYLTKGSVK